MTRMLCRHRHDQDARNIPVHRGAYYDIPQHGHQRRFEMPKPGRGSVREAHLPGAQEQAHPPGAQERGYQAQASELVVLLRLLRRV